MCEPTKKRIDDDDDNNNNDSATILSDGLCGTIFSSRWCIHVSHSYTYN